MTTAPAHDVGTSNPESDRHRAALRRLGLWIAVGGFALFVPMLATAALLPEWRIPAAFATLGAWVVWKIGRAMMKLNAARSA